MQGFLRQSAKRTRADGDMSETYRDLGLEKEFQEFEALKADAVKQMMLGKPEDGPSILEQMLSRATITAQDKMRKDSQLTGHVRPIFMDPPAFQRLMSEKSEQLFKTWDALHELHVLYEPIIRNHWKDVSSIC